MFKLVGLLTLCQGELASPLYYSVSALSKDLKLSTPSLLLFYSAIINAGMKFSDYFLVIVRNFLGYQVTGSHVDDNLAKTTAPPDVIWDIMRQWRLSQNPVPEIKYPFPPFSNAPYSCLARIVL
jgi:tRNA (guanine26-N2/guanine27-N2)-dimethyltransferase